MFRFLFPVFALACSTSKPAPEPSNESDVIIDADGDGYGESEDCNDNDASVFPSASEICDGIDNDCDDEVDEGVTSTFYVDGDGDGYGDADESIEACSLNEGYSSNGSDCNDDDPAIYPAAPEECDGIDNNCDGLADDDLMATWYEDSDGDGYGNPLQEILLCTQNPEGYVQNSNDCNDTEPAAYTNANEICDDVDNNCDGVIDEGLRATFYPDNDNDGYGGYIPIEACTAPTGHVDISGDCNDANSEIHPGAFELCDLVDNNCNGSFDEDSAIDADTWYEDSDGDGYGDPANTLLSCFLQQGYVSNADDCDDQNGSVHPNAAEIVANQTDDDCDGTELCYLDADNDGYRSGEDTLISQDLDCVDTLEADSTVPDGDCNDSNADIYLGAEELCDGVDNNCDGNTDEDSAIDADSWNLDADGDGYGSTTTMQSCNQPSGYVGNADDCDDANNTIAPEQAELCDGVDNNCDGNTDEDSAIDADTWYEDSDGDGYGDATMMQNSCSTITGYVLNSDDCDDDDSDYAPNAQEFCGSDDLNCDGTVPDCSSCLAILDSGLSYGDGLYMLESTIGSVPTYCDMTTDGGGWTLVQRTVWDWSDSQKLFTNYDTWYNQTLGNPSIGTAFRMAGVHWTQVNSESDQLLVHHARDLVSTLNCDPLYYQGEVAFTITSSATTANIIDQPSGVGILSSDYLSTTDTGASSGCVNGSNAVPWFYSSCCSTCPTYKGGYWNDEPHPMAHYVDSVPDLYGNQISNVCNSGQARQNDNASSFEGINEMEYYLR